MCSGCSRLGRLCVVVGPRLDICCSFLFFFFSLQRRARYNAQGNPQRPSDSSEALAHIQKRLQKREARSRVRSRAATSPENLSTDIWIYLFILILITDSWMSGSIAFAQFELSSLTSPKGMIFFIFLCAKLLGSRISDVEIRLLITGPHRCMNYNVRYLLHPYVQLAHVRPTGVVSLSCRVTHSGASCVR